MKCNSKGKIDKSVLDAVLAATREELMKEIRPEIVHAAEITLKSWELCVALTLHDIGFGSKRIKRFFAALEGRYKAFDDSCCITDLQHKGTKLTNMSTAFIQGVRELEQCGVNCREILNADEIIINDVNVFRVVDKMKGVQNDDKRNA
jgi:hypothetical protein